MASKFYNLDIDPELSANSDYIIPSQKAIKSAISKKQDKLVEGNGITISDNVISVKNNKLTDIIVSTSQFTEDSTYSQYPYKADISVEGITEDMIPEVYFQGDDALTGVFSPLAESFENIVRIYSKIIPLENITIDSITFK